MAESFYRCERMVILEEGLPTARLTRFLIVQINFVCNRFANEKALETDQKFTACQDHTQHNDDKNVQSLWPGLVGIDLRFFLPR
jgi:hypothetical protein